MAVTLNQREKKVITIAGCAIGLFMMFELIVVPLVEKEKKLERRCQSLQKEIEQLVLLKAEYDQIKQRDVSGGRDAVNTDSGFNLFAFLDTLADKISIKNNIRSMNPTNKPIPDKDAKLSIVDMKLNDITIEQLVKFIHGIEYSDKKLYVNRISITRQRRQAGVINAILQVETMIPS